MKQALLGDTFPNIEIMVKGDKRKSGIQPRRINRGLGKQLILGIERKGILLQRDFLCGIYCLALKVQKSCMDRYIR